MSFSPLFATPTRRIALFSMLVATLLLGSPLSTVNADSIKSDGMISISNQLEQELAYAIVSKENSINFSGNLADLKKLKQLRKQYATPFVWVKQSGQEYVLTDAKVVATIQSYWAALRPHEEKINHIEQKMKPYEVSLEKLGEEIEELTEAQEFDSPAMRSIERQMRAESAQIQHLSVGIEAISEQIERLSEQAQQQTEATIKTAIEQQGVKKL